MDNIKVMSVFGTRPEAIKMAPLIKKLEQTEGIESIVCVTAQHREMLDQVLEIFDLHPQYDLNIMQQRQTLASITTKALNGLSDVMQQVKPDLVLVHGDTTTTFSGALGAYYNQIKVGHVEAGLRTYDKYQPFPEEINRCLTSQLTDLHFAPTALAKEHLLKENVNPDTIFVTGNTVIDVLQTTIEQNYHFTVEELNHIDFEHKRIIAMTAHRRENIEQPLENICRAVKRIVEEHQDVEVVYAVHKNPAVSETVHTILGNHSRIHLLEPLDLKDMHNLMYRSYFVMTDSGGLQEEVPSMGKPVLVLRNVTERPEGIDAGTLKLAGTKEQDVYRFAYTLLHDKQQYEQMAKAKNPFGDGNASERIVKSILYYFGKAQKRPEDYIILKKQQKQGGYDMKKERMSILNMLEKGIITAQEAERLLLALNGTAKTPEREGVNDVVNQALNKAGSAINTFAKAVGKQAEKLEPKVKNVAEKMTEKACVIADDAKTYADKLREKRAKAKEEEQQDMDDTDDMEYTEYADSEQPQQQTEETVYEEQQQENKKGVVTKLFSNLTDKAELIQEHVREKATETKEFIGKVKELREDMKKEKIECEQEQNVNAEQDEEQSEENQSDYLKKADKNIKDMQSQLQQIDDMESFLKNAFGENGNWEEEDEEEEKKSE
ncbi:UDP-N-acetylglucosamine 2-epimerase (non-hydrolyzing) [Lachnospiraceae bacterium 46-61]